MGEVVEIGSGRKNLKAGDRVVVPFPISCGNCFFLPERALFAAARIRIRMRRLRKRCGAIRRAGIFGYSHLLGGYAGGQAEYARVPFADVGPIKIENGLTRRAGAVSFRYFPTGYMAAEACNIQPGDTIAVWGCGPVGQFAIKSAFLLGAERVIAIDRFPERLSMARGKAEPKRSIDEVADVYDLLDGYDRRRAAPTPASMPSVSEAHGASASNTPTTGPSRP